MGTAHIRPLISVVSPEYKGERMVEELVNRLIVSLGKITDNFEIILVNDGSPYGDWAEIKKACERDSRVKGLNLSRNFGQHYAITAGLAHASGEWVVVMDCDLQDRPEEIPNLYARAMEGWDIVQARRVNKKSTFLKKLSSAVYHKVFDWLSGQKTDDAIGNYGIYSRSVIEEFNKLTEKSRAFAPLISQLGFRRTTLDVQHADRAEGTSSYTLRKLLRLAFDTSISNTNKPLRIVIGIGMVMSLASFILAAYNIIAKLAGIIQVQGFTSTVFSIWFIGGLLLLTLGILGLYIDKIYDQVKGRPLFIVKEKLNFTSSPNP
ncbi:MAG: glycosyltransferase family 2 protein [Bacteroidales bacterium]|nr:glycosyltransferase family 2 protein [Bacteroidales bacterium]